MRRDAQVNNEIARLTAALKRPHWNRDARGLMNEEIKVLTLRLTPKQVEDRYYVDETAEEYREGDNDLWVALDIVARWLDEEEGVKPPSAGL